MFQPGNGKADLFPVVTPSAQRLLERFQKHQRLFGIMAIKSHPLNQLELLSNPSFALDDIPLRGREVIPLRGKPQPVMLGIVHGKQLSISAASP